MNATSIDRRAFLSSALALGTLILLPEPSSAQGLADISKEAVLNDPEVPVLGNAKGDVTLVEWFDYQCPYCKKAHPEIMRLVRDDGHIRLVMKDWPIFGPSSLYASRLTLAAGPHHEKALEALMATKARLSQLDVETTLTRAGFEIEALRAEARAEASAGLTRIRGAAEAGTFEQVRGPVVVPGCQPNRREIILPRRSPGLLCNARRRCQRRHEYDATEDSYRFQSSKHGGPIQLSLGSHTLC